MQSSREIFVLVVKCRPTPVFTCTYGGMNNWY